MSAGRRAECRAECRVGSPCADGLLQRRLQPHTRVDLRLCDTDGARQVASGGAHLAGGGQHLAGCPRWPCWP